MSYCVNCGVELSESEKHCPLCGVETLNPRSPWKDPVYKPYPTEIDTMMNNVDRRYMANLMTIFLLIPMFVSLVTDLMYGEGLTWAGYVLGAGAMLFVWIILPFYFKRFKRMLFLGLDCLALMLYLLFIDFVMGKGLWFLPLGLPVSAAFAVLLLISEYLFRRGNGQLILTRAAIILVDLSIFVVAVEVSTDIYVEGGINPSWSPFVVIPCLILAAATQIVERRKNLKEEIRKRMYY